MSTFGTLVKKNKNSDHVPSFRRMSSMLLNNLTAIVDTLQAAIKFSKHFYGSHFEPWPKIKIGLRTKLPWALYILIQSVIRKESAIVKAWQELMISRDTPSQKHCLIHLYWTRSSSLKPMIQFIPPCFFADAMNMFD